MEQRGLWTAKCATTARRCTGTLRRSRTLGTLYIGCGQQNNIVWVTQRRAAAAKLNMSVLDQLSQDSAAFGDICHVRALVGLRGFVEKASKELWIGDGLLLTCRQENRYQGFPARDALIVLPANLEESERTALWPLEVGVFSFELRRLGPFYQVGEEHAGEVHWD